MAAQGVKLEDYLKMTGSDVNSFRERSRPAAEKQTRTEVLLRAVAEAEGLEAAEDEMEKEFEDIAAQYGMKAEDVKKAVDVKMVRDQLMRKKAAKVIVENGVAAEPKEADEAEPEKAE